MVSCGSKILEVRVLKDERKDRWWSETRLFDIKTAIIRLEWNNRKDNINEQCFK